MARSLRRWSFISALILINVIVLVYLGVVIYARTAVGPMMGRGPSVSEEVDRIVRIISPVDAGFIGLFMLAATALYWFIGLRRVPEISRSDNHYTIMKRSLVLVPLIFSVAYMLIRYIGLQYFRY